MLKKRPVSYFAAPIPSLWVDKVFYCSRKPIIRANGFTSKSFAAVTLLALPLDKNIALFMLRL
jgi:hypothetical protein